MPEDEEQEFKQRKFMGNMSCCRSKKKMEMDGKRCERGGERVICIPTEGGEVRLRRSWRRGEEKINWGGKSETEAAK